MWVNRREELIEMLTNLVESSAQAKHDFGGEQREWHVPRLNKAFLLAAKLFPLEMLEAMSNAKTPYGNDVARAEASDA